MKNVEQQKAHNIANRAIAKGELIRPTHCQRCGKPDVQGTDGRTTIQAHHHDYQNPLDVEWICSSCHHNETPKCFGEKNGRAKLTYAQVAEIRASTISGTKLAKLYGVHFSTIYAIKNGETFK